MNTASEDLPRHLAELRERMSHPTEYERAVYYFLEEFAGDVRFMAQSEPDDPPHLLGVLERVASKALGRPAALDNVRVFVLRGHGFHHGSAAVEGRALFFFYVAEANTGVIALVPGVQGTMEIARFQLPAGLADPRQN